MKAFLYTAFIRKKVKIRLNVVFLSEYVYFIHNCFLKQLERKITMKIILTFFWIIIGAVLLWFFAENLDQSVTIDFFGRTYEHINLVTVIFVSTLLGLLLGTVIMTWQVIKHKARVSSAKRENKKLLKKIEELEKQVKEQEQAADLGKLPDDPDRSNSGFNP